MPLLRRIIAIFQIYGGIAGGFATLNNVITAELVGVNAVLGFIVLSYYVVSVMSGVLLIECQEVGRKVSRIIQAMAIPQIFFGFLHYQLINGAIYSVKVSEDSTNYFSNSWAIASQWSISFNASQSLGFGVNIFALVCFIILGNKSITKFK